MNKEQNDAMVKLTIKFTKKVEKILTGIETTNIILLVGVKQGSGTGELEGLKQIGVMKGKIKGLHTMLVDSEKEVATMLDGCKDCDACDNEEKLDPLTATEEEMRKRGIPTVLIEAALAVQKIKKLSEERHSEKAGKEQPKE